MSGRAKLISGGKCFGDCKFNKRVTKGVYSGGKSRASLEHDKLVKFLQTLRPDQLADFLLNYNSEENQSPNIYSLKSPDMAVVFERLICAREYEKFREIYYYRLNKTFLKKSMSFVIPKIVVFVVKHDAYDILEFVNSICTVWFRDYSFELMQSLIEIQNDFTDDQMFAKIDYIASKYLNPNERSNVPKFPDSTVYERGFTIMCRHLRPTIVRHFINVFRKELRIHSEDIENAAIYRAEILELFREVGVNFARVENPRTGMTFSRQLFIKIITKEIDGFIFPTIEIATLIDFFRKHDFITDTDFDHIIPEKFTSIRFALQTNFNIRI